MAVRCPKPTPHPELTWGGNHYAAHRALEVMVSGGHHCLLIGPPGVGKTTLAKKIRRLYNEKILAGFAGSSADSFALFSRFESKLEQFHGNLSRAAVELAKDWRTDRTLRHLEAVMIVADDKNTFLISGTGDLIEPDDGIVGIGSGGAFALAAARALDKYTDLSAREIVQEAMQIAAKICIYTNESISIEEL